MKGLDVRVTHKSLACPYCGTSLTKSIPYIFTDNNGGKRYGDCFFYRCDKAGCFELIKFKVTLEKT